jgi:hypothetical protein
MVGLVKRAVNHVSQLPHLIAAKDERNAIEKQLSAVLHWLHGDCNQCARVHIGMVFNGDSIVSGPKEVFGCQHVKGHRVMLLWVGSVPGSVAPGGPWWLEKWCDMGASIVFRMLLFEFVGSTFGCLFRWLGFDCFACAESRVIFPANNGPFGF